MAFFECLATRDAVFRYNTRRFAAELPVFSKIEMTAADKASSRVKVAEKKLPVFCR